MVILLGELDPPTHHEKEMKFSYSVFFFTRSISSKALWEEKRTGRSYQRMENPEDQQTKSKYFTLIFCFKKTKKNLGKAPPLDTWRQVNMRTRNLSESHNVRNRQRQFARQYDKIKFLNAVVSFIHWIKLFPDSLQHLVAVVGDFWMSDPSFWRCAHLIEAVLYLNAVTILAVAYLLKHKSQPFVPPTTPFQVITNSSTFKLTIRHDSEWLSGWIFVNQGKLHKTIYVGRAQHMIILLLAKIRVFRYQNVLWITTEYYWVFIRG